MKRILAIAVFLAVLASVACAQEYTAQATGFGGPVSVTITVEDGVLTACTIDAQSETPSIGGQAAKTLETTIAQTGAVEAVSGATMTSNAVSAALMDAMQQAGLAKQTSAVMQAGTYTGSAHGFSCIDKITVQVTVDETSIVSIELEDTFQMDRDSCENPYMAKGAFALLEPEILAAQSIGVDSVTGATGSSTGIKNAVRDTLTQAYRTAGLSEHDAANAVTASFTKAPAAPERKQETLTCDVVVAGAGASGTIASLTAQEAGLNVINVEKTFRWGGQSMITGGPKVFSPLTDEATVEATVKEYEAVNDRSRFGTDTVWNDPEYRAENGFEDFNHDAYPMSHQRMGAEFVTAFDVQQTESGELWSPNDLTVVLAVNSDGVYVTADGTPFKTEDIHSMMGGFSSSMGSYYLGSRYYVAYSASQLRAYAESGISDTTMGFQNTGEGTLEAAYAADATALNHADDEYYYVMACTGLSISSCGGIEVNEKMQAVREDGTVIDNLFVIGNDSFGNIMSTGAEYSIGGDAGMWCMGSADIAGKTAAQMVQGQ